MIYKKSANVKIKKRKLYDKKRTRKTPQSKCYKFIN